MATPVNPLFLKRMSMRERKKTQRRLKLSKIEPHDVEEGQNSKPTHRRKHHKQQHVHNEHVDKHTKNIDSQKRNNPNAIGTSFLSNEQLVTEDDGTDGRSSRGKDSSSCCGRFVRGLYWAISSSLGLMILLLCYSFIGAAIFQAIESPHEQQEKHEIINTREDIIQQIWNVTQENNMTRDQWRLFTLERLEEYEEQVSDAILHGVTSNTSVRVWDFWGALFFCATIYTTVGYGHISPATNGGRIATMLYSVAGIPLCLMVLTNLGKNLTSVLKWSWRTSRRYYYTRKCRRPEEKDDGLVKYEEVNLPLWLAMVIAITFSIMYILIGAIVYVQWETTWGYLEAFYFIFISISTIGFGDVLPEHPKFFLLSFLYIFIGLALVAMMINIVMETFSTTIDIAKVKIEEASKKVIGIDLNSSSSEYSDSDSDCLDSPGKNKDTKENNKSMDDQINEIMKVHCDKDTDDNTNVESVGPTKDVILTRENSKVASSEELSKDDDVGKE
ncbi:unnamed protein product [Owenia fusiformis]|uniref:Uncharacterized protein n=1 Tax=Owenia fusiformis TaxID=6347 RepID=A0A8J1T7N5_OWEFU|nr:unnamed protein product [Owenia fusiformis]